MTTKHLVSGGAWLHIFTKDFSSGESEHVMLHDQFFSVGKLFFSSCKGALKVFVSGFPLLCPSIVNGLPFVKWKISLKGGFTCTCLILCSKLGEECMRAGIIVLQIEKTLSYTYNSTVVTCVRFNVTIWCRRHHKDCVTGKALLDNAQTPLTDPQRGSRR